MRWYYWIAGAASVFFWLGNETDRPQPATPLNTVSNNLASPPIERTTAPSTGTGRTVGALAIKKYVTGDRVNQRTGPSTKQRVMGSLPLGAVATVLATIDDWSEVESSLGRGWMASRFLSEKMPEAKTIERAQPKRQISAPTSREIQSAKQEIIGQSIASYPGSCPCPFNRDRAGRRCGGRSAWSRPGGYSPICYDSDVSDARLKTYFAQRRGASN